MSEVIKNRYEFVILFDVENGNPNGDPDAGNMPRIDPESGLGLVTDVCIKRKIRNYIETVKEDEKGFEIYIREDIPLNRSDREACKDLGISETEEKKMTEALKKLKRNDPDIDIKLRDFMCEKFYDIRAFGAVMLSAQCTDERVNKTTPSLFEKYGDPESICNMDIEELEKIIHPCGFYKNKAKNIKAMAKEIIEKYGRKSTRNNGRANKPSRSR